MAVHVGRQRLREILGDPKPPKKPNPPSTAPKPVKAIVTKPVRKKRLRSKTYDGEKMYIPKVYDEAPHPVTQAFQTAMAR